MAVKTETITIFIDEDTISLEELEQGDIYDPETWDEEENQ